MQLLLLALRERKLLRKKQVTHTHTQNSNSIKGITISRSLTVHRTPSFLRHESMKNNLPQNAHPRTCRCALRIASSWSSQMWSLQTRTGRKPRCHSKPLKETRGDKSHGQSLKRSHSSSSEPSLQLEG